MGGVNIDILRDILTNIILLFGLVFLINQGSRKRHDQATYINVIYGVLIGFITVIIMLNAWQMQSGIFFDTRSVMIGVTALFFSFWTSLVAVLIAILYRIFAGGIGVFAGVLTLFFAFIIGVIWKRYILKNWRVNKLLQYYLFGIVIHIFMLLSQLTLPYPMNIEVLSNIGFIVILTYPLAVLFLSIAVQNYDERIDSQHRILKSEQRYRSIITNSTVGIIQFNTEGVIEVTNQAFADSLHTTIEQLIGLKMFNLPNKAVVAALKHSLEGEKGIYEGMYESFLSKHVLPVRVQFHPIYENNQITGGIGLIENLTQVYAQKQKIKQMRLEDPLTHLPNRLAFEETLEHYTINNSNLPLTISTCDINTFRIINKSFGYEIGNEVLISIAKLIKQKIEEPVSQTYRIEGDQFVILMPNTSKAQAEMICQQLKHDISNMPEFDFSLNVSVGSFTITTPQTLLTTAYERAEKDLQANKIYDDSSISKKTIDVIMTTLFEKNKREQLHSERVSHIAKNIAMQFNQGPSFENRVELAGKLHDIGKINISSDTLNKPGKLTNEEYTHIKKHSEMGYKILSSVPEYAQIASIVLNHHERPDGSGYPYGLTANQISLESKIIAVADAYDAMIEERPYKNKLSQSDAIEELQRCAETQFDKDVVNKLIKHLKTQ